MIAYVNNEFLPAEAATLPLMDLAITRAYSIFDYLIFEGGVPLFLDQYLERFFNSALFLRLQVPKSKEQLTSIIQELIQRSGKTTGGIRLQLTGGESSDLYTPVTPVFFITVHDFAAMSEAVFQAGIHVITREYVRTLPQIKSTNYLMGIWMQEQQRQQQAQDVLFHLNGEVSELPRANIFAVKGNEVITPADNILYGITRANVLQMHLPGIKFSEGRVCLQDLQAADEIFISSSTKRIMPVTRLDGNMVSNGVAGPVTTQVGQLLQQRIKEYVAQHAR